MVHGVEVGGNQVDWIRQAQAADVLLQEAYIRAGAIACGHHQHLRRPVHTKDRNAPALVQIAGKESGTTPDIGGRAKLYAISSYKRFESSAGANEVGNSKGRIISRRKLAVRPSEMVLRCDELHGHGWYDAELQIT